MDDSSFLRTILEDPASDHPRLVWADALDERGDPRGEFVRVQCELARWPHYGTCLEACAPPDFEGCPNRMLRRREWELAFRCAAWAGTDGVVKALGADHVRRLGLSMGFTDLEFSLGGRPVALGEFRRGFVAAVTLTTEQFLGGPCGRCGGTGDVAPPAMRRHQLGGSRRAPGTRCPDCHDTGHVEGLTAALFAAAPVTEVRLSDREPYQAEGAFWWSLAARPEMSSYLPNELLELLPGGKTGNFSSSNAAHAALCVAAVAYGRSFVHPPLPSLTGAPATESKR